MVNWGNEMGRIKIRKYKIKTMVSEDQAKYIEGVRKWLKDSLKGKGKIV